MSWSNISVFIFLVLLFGVPALLFGLTIVVAMFERARLLSLRPPTDAEAALPAGQQKKLAEAADLGYADLGIFVHEGSFKIKWVVSLLLSPDRRVLLLITHFPTGDRKHAFITILRDGRTIRTYDVSGVVDQTGSQETEMFPSGTMAERERYHRERIADREDELVPWEPTAVPRGMEMLEHARVSKLIAMGLARWRDEEQRIYTYTIRGAMGVLGKSPMKNVKESMERSEAKIAAYRSGQAGSSGVPVVGVGRRVTNRT